MNEKLVKQEAVKEVMGILGRFDKIPLTVQLALKRVLGITKIGVIKTSAKSATSENQSVNEGGVGTYSVLKPPDDWLEVEINGATYYIPVFT
jgi:hypothetical protein